MKRPARKSTAPRACPICGAKSALTFCGSCGARMEHDRLQLRPVLAGAARKVLELDHPVLRTVADLTRRPGRVVQAYVGAERERYSNPFQYCLLACALLVVALTVFDVQVATITVGGSNQGTSPGQRAAAAMQTLVQEYYNVFTLLGVPVFALASRVLFLNARFNLAEHLVLGLYVVGHLALFRTLVAPFGLLEADAGRAAVLLIEFAYLFIAARQFFGRGRWATFWRVSLLAMAYRTAILVIAILTAALFVLIPMGLAGEFGPAVQVKP